MITQLLAWYWCCWMMGLVPGINGQLRGWRNDLAFTNGER
jgi:hypothetical protein